MERISTELKAGSFWAIAVAAAFALVTFQIAMSVVGYVLFPVVARLIDVNLDTIPIRLSGSDSSGFRVDPYQTTVLLGPTLRVLLAGVATLIVLAQCYRWSLSAAAVDTVECPYCLSAIPDEATRCAYCGADQPERGGTDSPTL
jgi:hypothetical protein